MRIPYTYTDPHLPDIEVELECSLYWRWGEPVVSIDDVTADGVSFFRHPDPKRHALFLQLALAIADEAEDDDAILTALIEDDDPAASRADALHQARMEGVVI